MRHDSGIQETRTWTTHKKTGQYSQYLLLIISSFKIFDLQTS